jgi:hypothetical protein
MILYVVYRLEKLYYDLRPLRPYVNLALSIHNLIQLSWATHQISTDSNTKFFNREKITNNLSLLVLVRNV